ncbi:MAG: serine/threonine protein kinase, partial [Planctomycetota bacterium]
MEPFTGDAMPDTRPCPRCHATLALTESPQGLCPKCLLAVAMGAPEVIRTRAGQPVEDPPRIAEIAALFPALEVLGILGRGGMGVVYRARQRELDRIVALKILPIRAGDDPAFEERFVREARALASLAHENIVSVYDSGRAGDFYYILMEFVDGPNLRQMIRSGDVRPAQALALVSQVCAALDFAHSEGIVHRDIKPENILIDQRGRVKIADFGLAKLLDPGPMERLTRSDQAMGTLQYMAPEQLERPLEVDHRADIYSLGVVLYELLTGELPLGRFPPPSAKVAVDVRLDEVVLRALEKEPERRYQRAIDVKTDVDAITQSASMGAAKAPGSPAEAATVASAAAVAADAREESSERGFHGRRARRSGPWPWALGCCGLFVLGFLGILTMPLFLAVSRVEGEPTPGGVSEVSEGSAALSRSSPWAPAGEAGPPWPVFESLLADGLGLDPAGREIVRLVAFSRFDQYLRLEGEHTTVTVDPTGTRFIEIAPFAEELRTLETEFLDDLAAMVPEDHRTELRSRIELEEMLPFGREETTIRVEYAADGDRIRVSVGGETWSES